MLRFIRSPGRGKARTAAMAAAAAVAAVAGGVLAAGPAAGPVTGRVLPAPGAAVPGSYVVVLKRGWAQAPGARVRGVTGN